MGSTACTFSCGTSRFRFEPGNHICVFHRSDVELLDILTPYVADGLRNGERCICIQKPQVAKQLYYRLQYLGVDTERETRRGSLGIHFANDIYLHNGKFEPEKMMEMVEQSIRDSSKRGFRALRGAGDLSWAAQPQDKLDLVIDYENRLQARCPGKSAILMCQYRLTQFPSQVLDSVVRAHQFSIARPLGNSMYASLGIRHGQYEIDIVARRHSPDSQFDFVVRRNDGCILGWGSESAFEAAKGRARTLLAAGS